MKRGLIGFISIVFLCSVFSTSIADNFSLRNGIGFGDTMASVEEKESFSIAERTENTLKTVEGTIASIDKSYIIYTFSSNGILEDVYMDFGVHIGKPEQAKLAYSTVYEALVGKYGTPSEIEGGAWYVIYGSAVEKFASNASFLQGLGLTPSLQDCAQWILRYDDINAKIDLIRYAPNGVSSKSVSSDVIVSYHFFTDDEEQKAINALDDQKQSNQNDL